MDPRTQRWYGIAAGGVVIVAVIAIFLATHNKAIAPSTSTDTATSTFPALATTSSSNSNGNAQITGIADESTLQKPDLNRPYTPLASWPASVQADSRQKVATAVQQLKFNPNGIAYWLQLAMYRKSAQDYVGAEEVWVYITKRWTTDPIAFANLGDLYAFYLKDSTKAVEYWNKAIALDPKNINLYLSLSTYQSVNLKDTAAARATLQAGLKANPGDTDLQRALDALK